MHHGCRPTSTRLVYGVFWLECVTLEERQCATHIVPWRLFQCKHALSQLRSSTCWPECAKVAQWHLHAKEQHGLDQNSNVIKMLSSLWVRSKWRSINSAVGIRVKQTCANCMSSALLLRRTRILASAGVTRALQWIQSNHKCSFHIVISLCAHNVFLFHSSLGNYLYG